MISTNINNRVVFISLLLLALAGVIIGSVLVMKPLIVWGLLAVLIAIILIRIPAYNWALLAMVLSVFSRLLTFFELAPGFFNFIHFPIVMIAAFVATSRHPLMENLIDRKIMIGCIILGLLAFISWLVNGGSILQPIMSWLLYAEPFILVYAMARSISPGTRPHFVKLAFFTVYIQVPLAIWQFYENGYGDFVQGTMMGQGAGAHIVGALTLLGLITIIGLVLSRRVNPFALFLGVPLLIVPILADAKQTIIAFIFSIITIVVLLKNVKLTRFVIVLTMIAVLIGSAFLLYLPLQMALDYELVAGGLLGKIISFRIIALAQLNTYYQLALGLGPGNSVSRTALASQEGYVQSVSLGSFGLSSSAATQEIFFNTENDWLYSGSSVWGGISSFLGLFGDLGLLGLFVYLWILSVLWKALGKSASEYAIGSKGILVMAVVLGMIYSWLEMPEFMISWAVFITIGLTPELDENTNNS